MTRNKFNARRTELDGYVFASAKEAKRYGLLKILQRCGDIERLEVHPVFPLTVEGRNIGRYTADFYYFEDGRHVVEDVKGGKATRTEAYSLRIRLFKALYPHIEVRET